MEHKRFSYSPITERKPLNFPGDARIAVWVVTNIEHFHFDKPNVSIAAATAHLNPDILNYSWRDYGARVGVWRVMETLNKHDVNGSFALNSEVCEHYPQIIQAGNEMGCEWIAHGTSNSIMLNDQNEEQERDLIQSVINTIKSETGTMPRGWLGPALSETLNTPDILAECGIEYVCDWVNDEQPYPMKVKEGSLISLPYTIEINDVPVFVERKLSAEDFYQMIVDQFDVLYEDSKTTGRVMTISLHPFLIGHPYRCKYLDKALDYISARQEVWMTRGCDILDWYQDNHLRDAET